METKICSRCALAKEANNDNFYWKKGNQDWTTACKNCCRTSSKKRYEENKEEILEKISKYQQENKLVIAEKAKEYYEEHKDIILERINKYQQENKEVIAKQKKEYYEENKEYILEYQAGYREEHKEIILEKQKIYQQENKYIIAEKRRERYKIDYLFRIQINISKDIRQGLKERGVTKNGISSWTNLPYTPQQLADHIESLFEPWMSWNNHGIYNKETWNDNDPTTWTWQLDHIIPHSTFIYTDMKCQAFLDCWALSNLRPYSAKANIIDGNRRTNKIIENITKKS